MPLPWSRTFTSRPFGVLRAVTITGRLAVAQGVAHQVGHDHVEAPGIDGEGQSLRHVHPYLLRPAAHLQAVADRVGDVHGVHVQRGRARVEPARLDELLHQGPQPLDLPQHQPYGRRGLGGSRSASSESMSVTAVIAVSGVLQLVGDVGDEPAGHRLQRAQLGHAPLQGGRGVVERGGELGELVLAVHGQAGVQVAGAERAGRRAEPPDRQQDLPGRHQGQGERDDQHDGAGAGQRLPQPGQELLLLGEGDEHEDASSRWAGPCGWARSARRGCR